MMDSDHSDASPGQNTNLKPADNDPTLEEWKKRELRNKIENFKMRGQSEKMMLEPKKTCLHQTFSLISFIMGMAGFLMLIGQLVGVYFYEYDPIQGVVRCYVILMCLIIILNELEWTSFVQENAILHLWITRGMFYAFVGVLGLEQNDVEDAAEHAGVIANAMEDTVLGFIHAVAYLMVACGFVYVVMGSLCLQIVRNRVVSDYEERNKECKRIKDGSSLVVKLGV